MPGGIGWIYGGIAPWRQRIELIVKKIRNVDCDVVCLQEVHDQRLAQKIVQLLKDKYLFAVYHIGQKEMGMWCFLDSGLMVLSKYKIIDPRFTSFIQVEGAQKDVNKGCFDFALETRLQEKIAHIFATHLEPSPDDFNPSLKEQRTRMLELELIMEKMETIVKEKHKDTPVLLIGDLNMDYKGKEYRDSVLERNFYNGLSKKALKTCTSRFSDYMWTYSKEKREKISLGNEVTLDYILILKSLPRIGKDHVIKNAFKFTSYVDTRRMYDESYPEGGLSDHNALAGMIFYQPEHKLKFVAKKMPDIRPAKSPN
jgi:endonuclease/exonuclease/phosphatase family metal-dependent hydrolase